MASTFISEAITGTRNVASRIEITFVDAAGRLQTVSITPATANTLSIVAEAFGGPSRSEGPLATKMPRQFAVGSGRYEQVVLVRFEDDAPYGLEASQAAQLGYALVEQAAMIAGQSAPLRQ